MGEIVFFVALPIICFALYIWLSANKTGSRTSSGVNSKLYMSHIQKNCIESDIVFNTLDSANVPFCFLKGETDERVF